MKRRRIIKGILTIILIILQILSLSLLGYGLYLYKGIETFYRIYIIIILSYFTILFSHLLIRSLVKNKKISYIILCFIFIILASINSIGYYYLTKIYKIVDSYSSTENLYSSSLVTYNKDIKDHNDLKDNTIGIIDDKEDIEGNLLPLEIIDELKLEEKNKVIKYSSTMELLTALKNNEIDAAFFSTNYNEMFSSLEGFETIEEETKVLYTKSKTIEIVEEIEETASTSSLSKPFTMLFIGVDSSKNGVTSGYNADVLILVTFNPKTLQATMTSIPRDMYMKTACSGSNYRRINTTTWGSSSSCAVKTVENLFDVNIDYYAKINFKGIVQLVDALGGIDIDVPYSLCDQNSSRKWGDQTVYVEKGFRHLNGEQALALARNRHSPNDGSTVGKLMGHYCPTYTEGKRNDYTRGKNQLKVIMGIVSAATKLRDVNQAIDILETISKNFQTNIKAKDVMELYNLGKTIVLSEDTSNIINVQRTQLSGYGLSVREPGSNHDASVTIPYNGSIKDIKEQIYINLGKKKPTLIKKISFDLNNLYTDIVIGNQSYSQTKMTTLANLSNYSISDIKSYAEKNGFNVKFVNIDDKTELDISSWGSYKFVSQSYPRKTLTVLIDTLIINVQKVEINNGSTNDDVSQNPETSEQETPETSEQETPETSEQETPETSEQETPETSEQETSSMPEISTTKEETSTETP